MLDALVVSVAGRAWVGAACVVVASCGSDGGPRTPDHYVGSGRDCGAYEVRNDDTSPPDLSQVRHCLRVARDSGGEAYASVITETDEGHPIRLGFQATEDHRIRVETDWNGDPNGPDGTQVHVCEDIAASFPGHLEPLDCFRR